MQLVTHRSRGFARPECVLCVYAAALGLLGQGGCNVVWAAVRDAMGPSACSASDTIDQHHGLLGQGACDVVRAEELAGARCLSCIVHGNALPRPASHQKGYHS